jgi:hypothetical protein
MPYFDGLNKRNFIVNRNVLCGSCGHGGRRDHSIGAASSDHFPGAYGYQGEETNDEYVCGQHEDSAGFPDAAEINHGEKQAGIDSEDWVTLDELGVTIHFVKENAIVGPESKSNEQFMHGMKVLMARNYSLNLGEETMKGMLEKARAGIYPSFAPVGYCNTPGPNGKRIIQPDPDTAPVIVEIFRRFASGRCSLRDLVSQLRAEGVRLRVERFIAAWCITS